MFETVVIATDGSESAQRGVRIALDLADRFDATVHALYVIDAEEIPDSASDVQEEIETTLQTTADDAISFVSDEAGDGDIVTEIRRGNPSDEIVDYADTVDADVIAMGTRGRHGEHAFLLGSVAESVVRRAPQPVMTTRQLDAAGE